MSAGYGLRQCVVSGCQKADCKFDGLSFLSTLCILNWSSPFLLSSLSSSLLPLLLFLSFLWPSLYCFSLLPSAPSHIFFSSSFFPPSFLSSHLSFTPSATKANRLEVAFCFKLKDKFDPRTGKDFIFLIMRHFAKLVLHRYVRPFILLIYGFTLTACLALVFQVQIGLSQTIALPKVGDCVRGCVCLSACLPVGV